MISEPELQAHIQKIEETILTVTPSVKIKIFSLLDLTYLNEAADSAMIDAFCAQAHGSPFGNVAAVCLLPQFVPQAVHALAGAPIKITTVANFPFGTEPLADVLESIDASLQMGAEEIDVVFPYLRYLAGEKQATTDFISACKEVCGPQILKVILETGVIPDLNNITEMGRDVLMAGADFLKTSTGRVDIGVTLRAATVMLLTIKDLSKKLHLPLGFKASGGIRTSEQALQYMRLAENILGADWLTPGHFRIGASQLT